VGKATAMGGTQKCSRSVYSICAYLTSLVPFVTYAGSVKLRIIAPQHGTIMNISDLRVNNGLDMNISVSVRTHEEYATAFYGRVLCLYINGTAHAHVGGVSMSSTHSLVVPSILWQVGQTWIHVGLCNTNEDEGGSSPIYASTPILVKVQNVYSLPVLEENVDDKVTLVLPLMIDDAHRALLLVGTLQAHSTPNHQSIQELLVVVPDTQAFALDVLEAPHTCPPISVINESSLFNGIVKQTWHAYALQMAVKLLVAQRVTTNYYVTVDADILLVGTFDAALFFPGGRGIFVEEPRGVHPHWWRGSAAILGLTEDAYPNAAFGVTPAVLSTIGSVITTSLIRDVFKDDDWQQRWLKSWDDGTWWSEYTLYRLALDIRGLFDKIHVASGSETFCNPVWYHGDLPWDAAGAFHNENCVFSLVQSTTQLAPSLVAASIGFHVYHPHSSV